MIWYIAVNTFTPGAHIGYTVLGSHKTADAAQAHCRRAQPRARGSYLPTRVYASRRRYTRGDILSMETVKHATWIDPSIEETWHA